MAESESEFSKKLHIMMFPWLATGHMTPFLHISNELASYGHKITFLLPNKALSHLQHLNLHPNLISFKILTIPSVSGLPPSTQTASEIPISLNHLLAIAFDLLRPQVEQIILSFKPDFVFFDFAFWLPQITRPLGIKLVCFVVVSAASIAITFESLSEEDYPSTTVILRGGEKRLLAFLSMPFGDGITFHERITAAFKGSDVIAMRTCEEIEGNFCRYLARKFEKKVLLTGPVMTIPENPTCLEENLKKWLDGFEPKSVIFCALGSQWILEKEQFQELLLGFEENGSPFLAALKPPIGVDSIEEALPKGFKERVRERGLIYGNWVQQPLILNHPSIACFVSHCGFGSMWESLMSDCQTVLIPHLGDQILNSKLLAQELKVAVEVKREENGGFTRHDLKEAIRSVMDGNDNAEMVRKNHMKWKEILTKPGFMNGYIDKFVKDLNQGWD